MKIAVTYENGEIFQHFGHTETFKLYEIENDEIVSGEIVSANGSGHEALADFLANLSVNVLVCGGIGDGAQAALSAAGIEICSGAQDDADAAVRAYLKGEIESAGVNCDHHHDHDGDEGCGSHCGGGCSGCGGCGFTTCEACAEAIAKTGKITLCPACDNDAIKAIADVLGVEPVEVEQKVAFIRCAGEAAGKKRGI